MTTKIQIKTWAGELFFEHEMHGNTIKETVKAMLKAFTGKWMEKVDLSGMDLSDIDFSNSQFDNSKFYNSQFDNSKFDNSKFYNSKFDNSQFDNSKFYNSQFYNSQFYNSKFYNSQFDNSKFDNSQFYNSKFYNSKFDNSQFYNSKFYNSQFYNSQFYNSKFDEISTQSALENGALESVKMDFFGRMLLQKNEVPQLRAYLIAGKVDGTAYEGDCCCFVGSIAKAANCNYKELPRLKPNSNSSTELWFYSIRKGDTPKSNIMAKITLDWIDEFLLLVNA